MFLLQDSAGEAIFVAQDRRLRLRFVLPNVVRVTFTANQPFASKNSRVVLLDQTCPATFSVEEQETGYLLRAPEIAVHVNKATGALSYLNAHGKVLLQEPKTGGKWLTPREVLRNVFDRNAGTTVDHTIDGARATAGAYSTQQDRSAFEAKLAFQFFEDEALFGLGSHEEGYANLRGHSRELYQQNMKAVVPHLVSTRGYSLLLDCGSLMTFHDDALGSYWWADCVDELDFYVIAGEDHEEVIRTYRKLTGAPPIPPKWAFGFVQSKERYVTADEMLDVVREHRRREIPLDVIVLDWKSWPNGEGWGQKTLDVLRFPDPAGFAADLHAQGAKWMISIWPIMTGGCENQRELLEAGLMLGNGATYDAFRPEARRLYWQQAERGLFSHGVDAWWCDCTEPFEADWTGAVKPEPHVRLGLNTAASKLYLDPAEINLYSLLHSEGIYEGQRSVTTKKRVLNLTRSSYVGQSRYGTFTWNGDVNATWETLRRSVAECLNFCSTGEPYWTVDAGGFFVGNRDDLWFWRGAYGSGTRGLTAMDALAPDPADTGSRDFGFFELYTRWLQYAAFLPMFRSHGTDVAREIWRFGEEGNAFYDAIAATIRFRYRLLPYIYSSAAQITFGGASLVTPLALAFPADRNTHAIADQYLFGPALLVCPVLRPMLFHAESEPIQDRSMERSVYLPESAGWYALDGSGRFQGGQWITAKCPLDRIPVYAQAGSILVLGEVMQYVEQVPEAPYEIRVYTGADACFELYEDAGDSYAYEDGMCARVQITWSEQHRALNFSKRQGSFPELVEDREFNLSFVTPTGVQRMELHYTGEACEIRLAASCEEIAG